MLSISGCFSVKIYSWKAYAHNKPHSCHMKDESVTCDYKKDKLLRNISGGVMHWLPIGYKIYIQLVQYAVFNESGITTGYCLKVNGLYSWRKISVFFTIIQMNEKLF